MKFQSKYFQLEHFYHTWQKLVHFLTSVSNTYISQMLSSNFYLVQTEAGDMIRDVKSMLTISVHHLNKEPFQPNPTELQFYSRYPGDLLAFETVNIKDYLRPMVASALLWYAQYIGYPEMNISSEDPRRSLKAG